MPLFFLSTSTILTALFFWAGTIATNNTTSYLAYMFGGMNAVAAMFVGIGTIGDYLEKRRKRLDAKAPKMAPHHRHRGDTA